MKNSAGQSSSNCSRRHIIKTVTGGAVLAATGLQSHLAMAEDKPAAPQRKGRIRQSVSRWCFGGIPMKDFCKKCVELGIGGIDLVGPGEWPVMKDFGLIGTCTPSHELAVGLNHKENHEHCLKKIREAIERTSEAGFPNVICFPGNRKGISEEEGAANCVEALKKIAGFAEEKKVTLIIELLNSKVNHADYQADHTAWAVDICKKTGSPNVKVLYDIYHMQIMEGDLIRTIRDNIKYIGHFHTGGNPGRAEIDDTQEINYKAVMQAIAETKYSGWVAHEFCPKRDPITSLKQAVEICDV